MDIFALSVKPDCHHECDGTKCKLITEICLCLMVVQNISLQICTRSVMIMPSTLVVASYSYMKTVAKCSEAKNEYCRLICANMRKENAGMVLHLIGFCNLKEGKEEESVGETLLDIFVIKYWSP